MVNTLSGTNLQCERSVPIVHILLGPARCPLPRDKDLCGLILGAENGHDEPAPDARAVIGQLSQYSPLIGHFSHLWGWTAPMQRRAARAASMAAPPSRRTSRPTPAHGPASVAMAPPENSPYCDQCIIIKTRKGELSSLLLPPDNRQIVIDRSMKQKQSSDKKSFICKIYSAGKKLVITKTRC